MAINYKSPVEIRDFRNGDWFWISKYVWNDKRLSSSDKIVYGTIAFFSNQKQAAFPSIETMAFFSKVSERQTYRSIKSLENFGYIFIKRGGGRRKPNEYHLLKINPDKIAPFLINPDIQSINPAKSTVKTLTDSRRNNNILTRIYNKKENNKNLKKLEEMKSFLREKMIIRG